MEITGNYQFYTDSRYDLGPVNDNSWVHLAQQLQEVNRISIYLNIKIILQWIACNTASIDSVDANNFKLYKLGVNRAGNSIFCRINR